MQFNHNIFKDLRRGDNLSEKNEPWYFDSNKDVNLPFLP